MEKHEVGRVKRAEELPEVLTMPFVARILGCSLNTAYSLLELQDFPRSVVGHRVYIDKIKFLLWMNDQAEKQEVIVDGRKKKS